MEFEFSGNEEDMPEPLRKIVEAMRQRKKLADNVDAKLDEQTDKIEREVLMKLWADVGNSTYDYWNNMIAIKTFIKALKKMRAVAKLPFGMAIIVQKALIECAKGDLEAMEVIVAEKAKLGMDE